MDQMQAKAIIQKWYKALNFPSQYDERFQEILNCYEIPEGLTVENVDVNEPEGEKNLLYFLYLCEEVEQAYDEKKISHEILLDTLEDIVRWTNQWTVVKKRLYLGELPWLKHHFSLKLFKLGRLQFAMEHAYYDVPEYGLHKGDPTIGIHIPAAGPLRAEECIESLRMAREFFPKYFPEHDFVCFTCHSWLLGQMDKILPENSNILKFQQLFHLIKQDDVADDIIRYVFQWDTKREDLEQCNPSTSLGRKVKEKGMAGETFYAGLGIITKE